MELSLYWSMKITITMKITISLKKKECFNVIYAQLSSGNAT